MLREESDGLSVLRSDATGSDTAVDLLFQVVAADPVFFSYTDIDIANRASTLWFDSTRAPAADTETDTITPRRLHPGASVCAADRVAWDALPLPHPTPHQTQPAHVGYVRIRWSPDDPQGVAWLIAFNSRAVVWRYSVHGASGRALFIRDADGEVDFEPATSTRLPGNPDTVTVRSATAIAFAEKSPPRFQLMETTPDGKQHLIKQLPVASPGALARETVNGLDRFVAEIPVHL